MLHSYRPLVVFWAVVLLLSGAGAAALQALGPPPSGEVAAAPAAPVREAAAVAETPAPSVPGAASATAAVAAFAAPAAAPVLSGATVAAIAAAPPSPSTPPGPRKIAPPKAVPLQRAAPPGDGAGVRYGEAERRAPTRDIWGNPLVLHNGGWADRPAPAARGEGGYIGTFTVGPDGTRGFRAGP